MTPLWQFLALLAVHWIADFVLQTHWQASNKSKNNRALLKHVGNYTLVLWAAAPLIFGWPTLAMAGFIGVNFALHLTTDWCTSRVSSRLFWGQLESFNTIGQTSLLGEPHIVTSTALKKDFTLHNFFIVIGLDQLIHQATLAVTMWIFLT